MTVIRTDLRRSVEATGYCVLRQVIGSSLLHGVQLACNRVKRELTKAKAGPPNVYSAVTDDGIRWAARIEPIRSHSAEIADFLQHPSLTEFASDFLGQDVCLIEDKLVSKPPYSNIAFAPHQEKWWLRHYSNENVMLLVPLTSCSAANGTVCVAEASHKLGVVVHENDEIPAQVFEHAPTVPLALQPGDVAVMHTDLIHFSGPNRSSTWRDLLLLTYNSRTEGDLYETHQRWWSEVAVSQASMS
jgi:ectoine hydroxylase-related dioxygenase (phytanoyl-CoA dioxygenase family)